MPYLKWIKADGFQLQEARTFLRAEQEPLLNTLLQRLGRS